MPAKILVVAAQPAIHFRSATCCGRDGHEMLTATDAQDGLRRWAADRPDLIVLDNDLPGPSGLELLARIRGAEPAGTHTPIVLLGGTTDSRGEGRARCAPVPTITSASRSTRRSFQHACADCWRASRGGPRQPRRGMRLGASTRITAPKAAWAPRRWPSTRRSRCIEMKRSVALVDANLQFGDHRVFLDLGPDQRSIVDAVTATAGRCRHRAPRDGPRTNPGSTCCSRRRRPEAGRACQRRAASPAARARNSAQHVRLRRGRYGPAT